MNKLREWLGRLRGENSHETEKCIPAITPDKIPEFVIPTDMIRRRSGGFVHENSMVNLQNPNRARAEYKPKQNSTDSTISLSRMFKAKIKSTSDPSHGAQGGHTYENPIVRCQSILAATREQASINHDISQKNEFLKSNKKRQQSFTELDKLFIATAIEEKSAPEKIFQEIRLQKTPSIPTLDLSKCVEFDLLKSDIDDDQASALKHGYVKFSFQYLLRTKRLKVKILETYDRFEDQNTDSNDLFCCRIYPCPDKSPFWGHPEIPDERIKNLSIGQVCYFQCQGFEELSYMQIRVIKSTKRRISRASFRSTTPILAACITRHDEHPLSEVHPPSRPSSIWLGNRDLWTENIVICDL